MHFHTSPSQRPSGWAQIADVAQYLKKENTRPIPPEQPKRIHVRRSAVQARTRQAAKVFLPCYLHNFHTEVLGLIYEGGFQDQPRFHISARSFRKVSSTKYQMWQIVLKFFLITAIVLTVPTEDRPPCFHLPTFTETLLQCEYFCCPQIFIQIFSCSVFPFYSFLTDPAPTILEKGEVKDQANLKTGPKRAGNGFSYLFLAIKEVVSYDLFCSTLVSYIKQCLILKLQLTRMI